MERIRRYYTDLVDRAVATAAEAALLVIAADKFNAFEADWLDVLGVAAGGAVLAVLRGLAKRGLSGREVPGQE